jgi:O-antigen ligase
MSVPIPILALAVVAASLLVFPFAARAFWASAIVRREWTSTSSLIFLCGMVGGLPTALSNLVSPRPEAFDAFGNVRVGLTGWAAQFHVLVVTVTLATAVIFFVLRVGREPVVGRGWIAIVLVVVVASADMLHGGVAELGPRLLTLLALLLAISVAQPGRPAYLGAAGVCLAYAFLSCVQAAVHPTYAFRTCRFDKCGPGGALYTGALSNENVLGLIMALSIPFVWLALRGRDRIVVLGYVAVIVALTGSRTAQIAAVAALLALVILRPTQETSGGPGPGPVRQVRSIVIVTSLAVLGILLPLVPWTAASGLGDRTYFWRVALDGIRESPLLGKGGSAWPRLYELGEIPISASYSPHNQWLDILYASGFAGLALFVVLLGHLLLRDARLITTSAMILVPILTASALERPWSFAINDGLTFTLLAALLCASEPAFRWSQRDAALPSPVGASGRPEGQGVAS